MKTKQLNVDPLQFIKVTTAEAAYILGFLWADGFLGSHYSINTEIVSDDAIVLEKIFLSTGRWHVFNRKRENYRPQTKFQCSSKMLYNHLKKLGFNHAGKCPKKILKTIPKNLQHYWFRGYFDGDGCWYYYPRGYLKQCTISSSINQNWSFMTNLVSKLKIQNAKISKHKSKNKKGIINQCSRFRFCRHSSIVAFGEFIYQGKIFGLERKLEKYKKIIA